MKRARLLNGGGLGTLETLDVNLLHTEILERLGPSGIAVFGKVTNTCKKLSDELVATREQRKHELFVKDFVGSVTLLRWAFMNGIPVNVRTFCMAARYGCLDVVKFLRQKRCPWDPRVFAFAARGGATPR